MNDYEFPQPRDIDAEQSVLGAMLTAPERIAVVVEIVQASDFYLPKHEQIFRAIHDLHQQNSPADAVTVADELGRRGELAKIGGLPYLHELQQDMARLGSEGHHAEIIRQHADTRRLRAMFRRGLQATDPNTTATDDLGDVCAELRLQLDAAIDSASPTTLGAGRAVDKLLAELLDSSGLDSVPALRPLVDGFLYLDTIARIIGPSGHMKSFVALDFAGHIGTGMDWRGHAVTQGTVLYLVAEGAGGIRKRVRAWEQYHGRQMENVRFLPRPVQASGGNEWPVLLEVCRRLEPHLIVLDTQARVTVGAEENSAKEMGNVVHRLEALRSATGACITLIHHQGLAGEHGRGSTAVKGALQTELRVNKKGKGELTRVIVSSDKQKDDEELPDVVFATQIVKLDGEAKADGTPVTSIVLVPGEPIDDAGPTTRSGGERSAPNRVFAVLRAASKPLTVLQIGDVLAEQAEADKSLKPLTKRTIQDALAKLAESGDAAMVGMGGSTNSAQLWSAQIAAVDETA